jgi:serine/threonine-protein kinase
VDEVAFGRYWLIELIGEGCMGKVFKAHDTIIDRDVAIKVLLNRVEKRLPDLERTPLYVPFQGKGGRAVGRGDEPVRVALMNQLSS